MQDDVQPPRRPQFSGPEGPQTSSTSTVFPGNQGDQFAPEPTTSNEPVAPIEPAAPVAPVSPVAPEKKKSNAKWIVIIILSLLVGLLAGYLLGGKMTESNASAKYEAQISSLQTELDSANATIKDGTKEGTKTVTQLQKENADLKATNAKLTEQVTNLQKQVADLEKQLAAEKAKNTTTP